jgi:hypothetical protein
MQVPRFSPRISLIEMAPRAAPPQLLPGRPALPCLSPAPQRTGSDWKNLPGTAQFLSIQADGQTPCLLLYIRLQTLMKPPDFIVYIVVPG